MNTKADQARYQAFMKIGCIVTRVYFNAWGGFDVHHLVSGNKRMGNQFTIPLTPYYHRGVIPTGMTEKEAYDLFGPSLAKNKREFVSKFGSELELLDKTNELLGRMKHERTTSVPT